MKNHTKIMATLAILLVSVCAIAGALIITSEDSDGATQDVTIGDFVYSVDDVEGTAQIKSVVDTITECTIPSTIEVDGKSYDVIGMWGDAFSYKLDLTSVIFEEPTNLTSVHSFMGCLALTSITIPDGVIIIGPQAFKGCLALESVTIPDSVTEIGEEAFWRCKALTSITIPDGVTKIEDFTFSQCAALTSVTIPDSVTEIGNSAFSSCLKLAPVTIPDGVTTIGETAFYNCKVLTSITIPDSVTEIGNNAFNMCLKLTSVTIPDTVTAFGEHVFDNCSSLSSVTTPVLNNSYSGCSALKTIVYTGEPIESWTLTYPTTFTLYVEGEDIVDPSILPSTVTMILLPKITMEEQIDVIVGEDFFLTPEVSEGVIDVNVGGSALGFLDWSEGSFSGRFTEVGTYELTVSGEWSIASGVPNYIGMSKMTINVIRLLEIISVPDTSYLFPGDVWTYEPMASEDGAEWEVYGLGAILEDGVITLTAPNVLYESTFEVTIVATLGEREARQSFGLTIRPDPLVITSSPPINCTSGDIWFYTPQISEEGAEITVSGLEGHVFSEGMIIWTAPNVSFPRSISATITATLGDRTTSQIITILVVPAPLPDLTITSNPDVPIISGEEWTYALNISEDGALIEVEGLTGAVIEDDVITWIAPDVEEQTIVEVIITATIGDRTATQTFSIVVSPAPLPDPIPGFDPPETEVAEDGEMTVAVYVAEGYVDIAATGSAMVDEGGFLTFHEESMTLSGTPTSAGAWVVQITATWIVAGQLVTETQTLDIVTDAPAGDSDNEQSLTDKILENTFALIILIIGVIALLAFAFGVRSVIVLIIGLVATIVGAIFLGLDVASIDDLKDLILELIGRGSS